MPATDDWHDVPADLGIDPNYFGTYIVPLEEPAGPPFLEALDSEIVDGLERLLGAHAAFDDYLKETD